MPFNQNSPQIWSDSQLHQWSIDSLGQIAADVNCIWARECLAIERGQSLYRLPTYLRTLQRVTWRGKSLDPVSWEEMTLLSPTTVVLGVGSSANRESTGGVPLFYSQHPTDPYEIRLFPTPGESLTVAGEPNPYAPTPHSPSCIISYWRTPDTNLISPDPVISLPPYVQRRMQKAYVLWKAFAAEGKGQDLAASAFYQSKYTYLIGQFRLINEGTYISKRYSLADGMLDPMSFRYPKPTLNSNFERVIF